MLMKLWKLPLALLALGLNACIPGLVEAGKHYSVTEIEWLTDDASERWTYFFGDPQTIKLESTVLKLEPAGDRKHVWAFPGALWVNGQPLFREVLPPLKRPAFTISTLPGFEYLISAKVDLKGVWFYDGADWFKLAEEMQAKSSLHSRGEPATPEISGLDAAQVKVLLDEAIARAGGKQFVLYQLSEPVYPDYKFNPQPRAYRKVTLALQFGMPKEMYLKPVNPTPAWEVLRKGHYSAYNDSEPYALLATSEKAFINKIWPLAVGRRVPQPPPPPLDFTNYSVAAFFWGTKPTGGYDIKVKEMFLKDDVLVVKLELRSPGPGSIVTQAITSPFLLLRVEGKPAKVRFIDIKGNLIKEARAE